MALLTVIVLITTLGSYVSKLAEGQDVFFGLKYKAGVHQNLNVNETDIFITCNVTCISAAVINIQKLNQFGSATANYSKSGTSFDYLIPRISKDLRFKCIVTYTTSDSGVSEMSKEAYWSPHVISEPGKPYCYRNGTVGQPYNIGDILLLECICDVTQECKWQEVITFHSEEIRITNLNYSVTPLDETRIVLQTIVGPIDVLPADHLKAYVCISNVSILTDSCPIHPRNVSNIDNVITPSQSEKCISPETLDEQIPSGSTMPLSLFLYIIIGAAAILAISTLILVVSVVCVLAKRRQHFFRSRSGAGNVSRRSDASELRLYDTSANENIIQPTPIEYDAPPSSSVPDYSRQVEQFTGVADEEYSGSRPYYYPFEVNSSDPSYYNNPNHYVNGPQV